MFQLLSKCIDQKETVSFYCDSNNPATHLTGFVAACTNDEVLISHISKEGNYDGFILIHSRDLYRIDFGGKYETKIKELYDLKKQSHPPLPQDESIYTTLLRFGQEKDLVVSVELADCTLSGFIADYNDVYIHLYILDECGIQNGESCVSNSDIISLAVDTSTEQDIKRLFSKRL